MTDSRPGLYRDRSFWGINLTQFLGAFNDNLYKELVLLLCLDRVGHDGADPYQTMAGAIFAVAFILISGLAGWLSDHYSKRTVIVLCKLAEIVVMLAGIAAFYVNSITGLMTVLFLMGAHSAFFGPPKYGILPEMLRSDDLPRANGVMLMTTFLAIIFGFATAGWAKEFFGDAVWMACSLCVAIACVGTLSSLLIRKTPVAEPNLKFTLDSLAIPRPTRELMWRDRELLRVMAMLSVFYLVAGMVYPSVVNAVGKKQMDLGDAWTGRLAATTGAGIAIGCVMAGVLCRNRVKGWLVRLGAAGLVASLIVLAIPGPGLGGTLLGFGGTAAGLVSVGIFAGFFSVPLQVYLQAKTPAEQRGRIIGAMNLLNWIGICLASVIYGAANYLFVVTLHWPEASVFAAAACFMVPVAIFYRPPNLELQKE